MKAVCVVWEDASTEPGTWIYVEGATPLQAKVFSQIGWLHSEDEHCVVLTSAVDEEGSVMAARERIPRGMVRSITELAPARKRSK